MALKYWIILILFIMGLNACGANEDKKLKSYINKIKSQPAIVVEPIPQFKSPSKWIYPEANHRAHPFKPKTIQWPGVSSSPRKVLRIRSVLLPINYAKAMDIAAILKDPSNSLLSARGALSVDVRTNSLWVRDTVAKIKNLQSLIRQLDVPTKQVLIEARIVDMTKDCAEDLGVRLGISNSRQISGTLAAANQLAQGISPVNLPLSQRLNLDLAALPLEGVLPGSIGIAVAKLGSGVLLDLELSALESAGRAEIIASPRLLTTNQQAAVIESGEDIPYQQSTLSGATAVAFKKAVLSLKATPQIMPDGKLLMDLHITQDADSGQRVQGVPIILTKSIQTNVLVNNGQTIVLGGIRMQNKNNAVMSIPFLGGLPVVGHLFRRTETTSKNEELLIFITPRIITNGQGFEK